MRIPQGSLAAHCIETLTHLSRRDFRAPSADELAFVEGFVRHFLASFVRDDFPLTRSESLRLIMLNGVIANLVRLTSVGTTDALLPPLLARAGEPAVLARLLALYSARNTIEPDPALFFAVDAEAASCWYHAFLDGAHWGCVNPLLWRRLRRVLAHVDPALVMTPNMDQGYFAASYIDDSLVPALRRQVHLACAQPPAAMLTPTNAVPAGGIALVSGRWSRGDVVHTALHAFIAALARVHAVTLVHLGTAEKPVAADGFANVIHCAIDPEHPAVPAVLQNRFHLLLYADIGLNAASVFLASQRLAPVQAALCGHPESSWSPVIDYFVHGRDVVRPDQVTHRFGERLLFLPGCAQAAPPPDYSPGGHVPTDDLVRIALCWSPQKIHHAHLQRLATACAGVERPFRFVFIGLGSCSYRHIVAEIEAVFGSHRVEVHPELAYDGYMRLLETCHFAIDSHPFGGYCTLIDLLWLRKPVLALQGQRKFNRNAAFLQRQLGLEGLTTEDPQQFCTLLRRLLMDDAFRADILARWRASDPMRLFPTAPPAAFVDLISDLAGLPQA